MRTSIAIAAFIIAAGMQSISPANATTYTFTVSCPDRSKVVQWDTGAVDPGKEYLRTMTGTKNPGCGVGDYSPSRDSRLPREVNSGVGGVFQGLPPVAIICGIFGC